MRRESVASQPRSWRTMARWPAFLLANATLLLVIGASTIRETYRGWSVDREIHALESQAIALEGRRSALESLTKDLVSKDRVEYDARAKLGLKQPGERVIILEGVSPTGTWSGDDSGASVSAVPTEQTETNVQRWWRYFFHD